MTCVNRQLAILGVPSARQIDRRGPGEEAQQYEWEARVAKGAATC